MADTDLADLGKDLLLDSSMMVYQSITDGECQKAAAAYKEFQLGNYQECLKILKSLQLNRPQDSKVFHNVAVTDFYHSKCCKITELYSNLLLICKQANIDVEDIDSIDDVDQCVLFFNRAVILYHLHKYRGAIFILDKVFQFVEPLDEVLGHKICLLLLELYLSTHQPKKALSLIGYIEAMLLSGSTSKSNKSPEKDEPKGNSCIDELKLELVQCKARCYAMMKTAKPCKREVKILMTSGSKAHHISAFVIKSQLEYQRGNYRKAMKILNSIEWPDDFLEYFMETGDCLQAMYYNNLSCVHYYMGKPGLGAYYAERGLKELQDAMTDLRISDSPNSSSQAMHTMSLAVKKILLYNLGMQHFQRQKYYNAFKCFLEISDTYSDNPRLWLRIAECCIHIHLQTEGGTSIKYHHHPVKDVIGSGEHRKIILNTGSDYLVSRQATEPGSGQTPSLSFAICALSNALMLLPKELPPTETVSDSCSNSGSSQPVDEKDVNPLEEHCLQVLPCNAIPLGDVQHLRNGILIALSYVSLKLGDLLLAHDYAQQLLSQPKSSEAHKFLAHMYAGEALVYLDKISEAVDHFNPERFPDISQVMPPSPDETTLKHQVKGDTPERADAYDKSKLKPAWYPESLAAARHIVQYNLSVVYALRGEWSKALRLVTEVIEDENAPLQAQGLIIYIYLCQGATDVALSYLSKFVPLYQR